MREASVLYTDEQIAFIVATRLGGAMWPEVVEAYIKQFRRAPVPTAAALKGVFRRHSVSMMQDSPEHPYATFTREGIGTKVGKNTRRRAVFFVTAAGPVNRHSPLKEEWDEELGVRGNLFGKGFDALQSFLTHRKAELVILAGKAQLPALTRDVQHYDPELWPYRNRFFTEFVFNENLRARDLYLLPQQPRPLTGLHRLRGKKINLTAELTTTANHLRSSLIVGTPKQDMDPIPTGAASLPRVLQGTGRITFGEYLGNRIGEVAAEDHVLGGIIVEVDGPFFALRQVQFDRETGSFCDIHGTEETCVQYFPDRPPATGIRAVAWTPGDRHPGWDHAPTQKAWAEVEAIARPGWIFEDDWLDGASIAHQLEGRPVSQLALPDCFRSLEAELRTAEGALNNRWAAVQSFTPTIVLRFSNHPQKVVRYLDEGKYAKDRTNLRAAVRMLHHHFETGEHPLRKEVDPQCRFRWMGPNEDLVVDGVHYGLHGHLGPDGARGSPENLERVYGDAVGAHRHGAGIRNGMYTAGHMSAPRHGYNDGPSSWLNAGVLQFRNKQRMLIISIDGRWHG